MTSALRQLRRGRRTLYSTARLLGDLDAVATGRVPQRIVRRVVYGATNRQVRRLLRGIN